MNPSTRRVRTLAFTYKNEGWLNALSQRAAATIRAIASQFERGGTEGLENPQIFQTPEVRLAGGLAALQMAGNPRDLLIETKTRMFAAMRLNREAGSDPKDHFAHISKMVDFGSGAKRKIDDIALTRKEPMTRRSVRNGNKAGDIRRMSETAQAKATHSSPQQSELPSSWRWVRLGEMSARS